jgi:hypothetical protein
MMPDTDLIDQEPSENELESSNFSIKPRQSFSKLRRELSEDELRSPAVQRLLLEEVERLERQVSELTTYKEKYYVMDKRTAILEQKVKKSIASEVIFGVCLCVGAAALGFAPAVWNNQPIGYIAIVFGLILIAGGTVSRLVQR